MYQVAGFVLQLLQRILIHFFGLLEHVSAEVQISSPETTAQHGKLL